MLLLPRMRLWLVLTRRMRVSYPQVDGRGIVRRKWSALKTGGPLIFVAERVQKKLIQHGYPASYEALPTNRVFTQVVVFRNELGNTSSFLQCLLDCCEVVSRALRVPCFLDGCSLRLVGEWRLKVKQGYVSFRPASEAPF